MSQAFSPKLKTVMAEMVKVMEKHDVAGLVILADGQGFSEYRLQLFEPKPSWSMLRMLPKNRGVHVKSYLASKRPETEATINAVMVMLDTLAGVFNMVDQVREAIQKQVQVEVTKGKFTPGGETDV